MILEVSARAAYDLPAPTFVLLMIEPALQGENHRVTDENLSTTTTPRTELWNDLYCNPQRRFMAPAGAFNFEFQARIETDPNAPLPDDEAQMPPDQIPAECMIYTLPSRYCQSDKLQRLALSEWGDLKPEGHRINAICDWIRARVTYQYGTTNAMTDAFDTATSRIGVCRDFAHLTISFCRALGIPARYVSGYCLELDPPDFHAWVQVFMGGRWHNIDSTFEGVRPALVPIAFGRDAADVPMMTFFGTGNLREQIVSVSQTSG